MVKKRSSEERDEPEAYVERVSIEHGHRIGFRYGVGTDRFPCKASVEFICNTAFATRLYDWLKDQGIGNEPAPSGAPKLTQGLPALPAASTRVDEPIEGTFEDDHE